MFISPAYAQTGGDGAGGLIGLLPLILIFVIFYFLLIRPQQKKLKRHREMVAALRRGDRVITGGGLMGKITRIVDDNEVIVEVADGVRVRALRQTIQDVLAKPEGGSADEREGPRANADDDEPDQVEHDEVKDDGEQGSRPKQGGGQKRSRNRSGQRRSSGQRRRSGSGGDAGQEGN